MGAKFGFRIHNLPKCTWSILQNRLGHKTNLNKFKKTEIISIIPTTKGMKLEFSNRRKTRKFMNMWKLNNTLLNNQWT